MVSLLPCRELPYGESWQGEEASYQQPEGTGSLLTRGISLEADPSAPG